MRKATRTPKPSPNGKPVVLQRACRTEETRSFEKVCAVQAQLNFPRKLRKQPTACLGYTFFTIPTMKFGSNNQMLCVFEIKISQNPGYRPDFLHKMNSVRVSGLKTARKCNNQFLKMPNHPNRPQHPALSGLLTDPCDVLNTMLRFVIGWVLVAFTFPGYCRQIRSLFAHGRISWSLVGAAGNAGGQDIGSDTKPRFSLRHL